MEYLVNAKLRSRAYLKFILFFAVTVLMIVAAVYFDVTMPLKDNERLREVIKASENLADSQQLFITTAQTAKILVDSMNKSGKYNGLLDQEISKLLEAIKIPRYDNKSVYATMNKEVFNVLYDYYELTKKAISSKEAVQQVEKLIKESKEWENKYNNAQNSLDNYRKSNGLGL